MSDAELEQATRELNAAVNEVVRYVNNGSDYFIVNVGAFEIRFELAKLGKPKEEGGKIRACPDSRSGHSGDDKRPAQKRRRRRMKTRTLTRINRIASYAAIAAAIGGVVLSAVAGNSAAAMAWSVAALWAYTAYRSECAGRRWAEAYFRAVGCKEEDI